MGFNQWLIVIRMPPKKDQQKRAKKFYPPKQAAKPKTVRSSGIHSTFDDVTNGIGDLRLEDMTSRDICADTYSCVHIHEKWLKDRHQMDIYRQAIFGNKHLFRDKVSIGHHITRHHRDEPNIYAYYMTIYIVCCRSCWMWTVALAYCRCSRPKRAPNMSMPSTRPVSHSWPSALSKTTNTRTW